MPSPAAPDTPALTARAQGTLMAVRETWRQSPPIRIAGVLFGLLLLALAGTWVWGKLRPVNSLLATPALALDVVQTKSLYYNGPAYPWLRTKRPDLLGPEDQEPKSPRVRSFVQAVQNPKLFRQLDRQYRFDKLLLVGDPSQYQPLLTHLLETRDWTPEYVDHIAVIFHRGHGATWDPDSFAAVPTRLARASAHDRAVYLALTAGKLVALHQPATARQLLDAAQALDETVPEIWSTRAQYYLARGEWKECEAAANKSLTLEPDNLSALGAKAQALYSTRRFNEAYALSRKLIARLPDDPAMLFYHAKIAHEARAFAEEARALRHLIAIAEANDRPTSGYRVYLGQSLATAGEGAPALEEFKKALTDPDLPADQRKFAGECMALIRSQGVGSKQ